MKTKAKILLIAALMFLTIPLNVQAENDKQIYVENMTDMFTDKGLSSKPSWYQ